MLSKELLKRDWDSRRLVRALQSIYCFLISNSFEDAIRTVVSVGGDADTMGAIAGTIAEAFYGIPKDIEGRIYDFLTDEFIEIINKLKERIKHS